MKHLIVILSMLLFSLVATASNQQMCLSGEIKSCHDVMNSFGSKSDKAGAVEFFNKACSSKGLRISCQIFSFLPDETLMKTLELARSSTSLFVINGKPFDKVYLINK